MSLVKCLNCGAEIDSDLVKCPYCGYLNETGARKAHEETLEKIEAEIESNIAMGEAAYSQGVKKTGKSSAVGIGLVLVIFGLIALAFFLFWRFGDKTNVVVTPEKTVSEIAFIEDAFPRWDEMYYDEKFDELAKEFEEYSENHNLFVYENYEFLYAYSLYDRMKSEAVPALDRNIPITLSSPITLNRPAGIVCIRKWDMKTEPADSGSRWKRQNQK